MPKMSELFSFGSLSTPSGGDFSPSYGMASAVFTDDSILIERYITEYKVKTHSMGSLRIQESRFARHYSFFAQKGLLLLS